MNKEPRQHCSIELKVSFPNSKQVYQTNRSFDVLEFRLADNIDLMMKLMIATIIEEIREKEFLQNLLLSKMEEPYREVINETELSTINI